MEGPVSTSALMIVELVSSYIHVFQHVEERQLGKLTNYSRETLNN